MIPNTSIPVRSKTHSNQQPKSTEFRPITENVLSATGSRAQPSVRKQSPGRTRHDVPVPIPKNPFDEDDSTNPFGECESKNPFEDGSSNSFDNETPKNPFDEDDEVN